MTVVATTIDDFGTPTDDGTLGIIQTAGAREALIWNDAQQAWIGRSRYTCRMSDAMAMRPTSSGYIQSKEPDNEPPLLREAGFGFQLHQVTCATELWNAGLRIQECLSGELEFLSGYNAFPSVWMNWYQFDPNDSFLAPDPPFAAGIPGVVLSGDAEENVARFYSTGWQNSPIDTPIKASWMPDFYGDSIARVKRFTARYRWVGGTVGGLGGSDLESRPPFVANLAWWLNADTITQTNGHAIDEWLDLSGHNRHLYQSSAGAKPTLVRNALNGHSAVRFDGSNDMLANNTGQLNQPVTVFMVIQDNLASSGTHVWFDAGPNATIWLIYRDSTNEVHLYQGGSGDLIYTRGSSWPMSYTILTAVINGNSTKVYEGLTLKASGGGGNPGTATLGPGITLGARRDASLYSQVDIAEVLIYGGGLSDGDRTAVEGYLSAKYGL